VEPTVIDNTIDQSLSIINDPTEEVKDETKESSEILPNQPSEINAEEKVKETEKDPVEKETAAAAEEEKEEEEETTTPVGSSQESALTVVSIEDVTELVEDISDDEENPPKAGASECEKYSDGSEKMSENDESEEISDDDDEDDDDALMVNAMNACQNVNYSNRQQSQQNSMNDEPIALDDSDDDEEVIQDNEDLLSEPEPDESDNESLEEEQEDEEELTEESFRTRMFRTNPRYYIARTLVKRSIRFVNDRKRHARPKTMEKIDDDVKEDQGETSNANVLLNENDAAKEESKIIETLPEESTKQSETIVEKMEVDEVPVDELNTTVIEKQENEVIATDSNDNNKKEDRSSPANQAPLKDQQLGNNSKTIVEVNGEKVNTQDHHQVDSKSPPAMSENTNLNSLEGHNGSGSGLLNEITACDIDELMNRYVFRTNNDSQQSAQQQQAPPSMEDFSEELLYCLQQNKLEIQKAQQVWNEKIHVKYKIRELLERTRRHKAVIEIETFGFKPSSDNLTSNLMISSKSSTTTNSENENFDKSSRMSSEAINRYVQDVRVNVLKKEDKQQQQHHLQQRSMDEFSSSANMNESLNDLHNLSQANSQAAGRQGQTIDVQSLIKDFRQKNPQEIPRRGRRMKSSFGNSFMMESPLQSHFNKSDMRLSNAQSEFNNSIKSNHSSGGFPEISLLPVNNFYKNLSMNSSSSNNNNPGSSNYSGQKSSLLQSILTKVI
jgi:hypothetical protein